MTTAEEVKHHSQALLIGLAHQASGDALDKLVTLISHALTDSLDNGDRIFVAGTDQRLTTRLQVLSALNRGRMIDVQPASSTLETR